MRNAAITLVNSEHFRDGNVDDRLRDAKWVEQFLARSNIPQPASRGQLVRLRELRALLRRITEQLAAQQSISDRTLDALNGFLEPVTVRDRIVRTETGGFTHNRDFTGHVTPTAVIARDFLRLLVEGDWRRLKICANDACRWAFYDESRNRIRIWCDSTRCGNVMKVRRFRERNRT